MSGKPIDLDMGIIGLRKTDVVHMDGSDPAAKIAELTKAGAVIGFCWAVVHAMPYHPTSAGQFALSAAGKTALFASMGAIFAGTTSIAAKATGKDRKINYFLGGCTAGTLLGARSKSISVGTQSCVFFGGLAALRKWYDENGWEFK